MHFEGRGLAIPGLFSVAMLCDFAIFEGCVAWPILVSSQLLMLGDFVV